MLKDIQLHVEQDEALQHAIEQSTAPEINRRVLDNSISFQHVIPTVYQQIRTNQSRNASIFCNRAGELNIFDYRAGGVLYGLHPRQEIDRQLASYVRHPVKISLAEHGESTRNDAEILKGVDSPVDTHRANNQPLPPNINVMVVFGIGLGYHIAELIERFSIKHLIVYEPEFAYFRCSLSATSWKQILNTASKKGTALYLQLEQDGSRFTDDLQELAANVEVDEVFLYRHYNDPTFNQLEEASCKLSWPELCKWLPKHASQLAITDYVSPWTHVVEDEQWRKDYLDHARFEKNLQAFKHFLPALYKEFSDYEPVKWMPLGNARGEVNVFYRPNAIPFYSDSPKDDCEITVDAFSERPNKDGLVLGYRGKKLKPYLHYQMVNKAEKILDNLEGSKSNLPETIRCMIMFGLGVGYQLETLSNTHNIEKLFVCEPNRDYFYASLFAIDWDGILTRFDDLNARIYINVGDDGSNIIEDLLTQFHSIGPYVLANSYFFQSYHNALLTNAIVQLREQLKVIVAMGDFFDHAKYGVAHTTWSVEQGIPYLKKRADKLLSWDHKNTPVFIVGNGPSLDGLISTIKEHQHSAIVISCGTALQTLHRHGIKPDFHAEIEANRSTFDWAVRIGDLDYLKQITLISCNGIHPDTCGLYKDVLLVLKEGESSTVSLTELFGKQHPFEIVSHAYPTVTNFVANFCRSLGMQQWYLLGVDMGFVDPEYHHSKSSGYYTEKGEERYSYQEDNDTSIVTEGNFRATVRTKYEFRVSKRVLEQTLPKQAAVYNLNDGAKINGAEPLRKDNIIVLNNESAKQAALTHIRNTCFTDIDRQSFITRWRDRYDPLVLVSELKALITLVEEPVEDRSAAESFADRQRTYLVDSLLRRKSLLFYYLNGTMNFVNSALIKACSVSDDDDMLSAFNELKALWLDLLINIASIAEFDNAGFDFISSFEMERRRLFMALSNQHDEFAYKNINASDDQAAAMADALGVLQVEKAINNTTGTKRYSLHWMNEKRLPVQTDEPAIAIVSDEEVFEFAWSQPLTMPVLYLPGDFRIPNDSPNCQDVHRAFMASIAVTGSRQFKLFLPKLILAETDQVERYYDIELIKHLIAYDCGNFIGFADSPIDVNELTFGEGTRARFISHPIDDADIVQFWHTADEITEIKRFKISKFNALAVTL